MAYLKMLMIKELKEMGWDCRVFVIQLCIYYAFCAIVLRFCNIVVRDI